ncbi:chromate transporter [Bdellovibrio bacteriovorus]|uniref:Chromate transporter n=1 Tax=Bdellovibrio bacteriovorus TaxID=959 RepID=A0A150WSC5_BDEBC|nr:chromate transporter [Bdellovibrio bacteriovorus]
MWRSVRTNTKILKELFWLFLKLGTTAFGGPAAHIAMMQNEVVVRRKWLSQEEFLDLLSATNFIPGPNSTELAIHIGHKRAGWRGLIVAGVAFIFPAVMIVSAVAWVYVTYGNLPALHSIMYGIKPVIIAVVLQAIWSLSKSAVKSGFLAALGVTAIVLNAAGVGELTTIFGAGVIAGAFYLYRSKGALSGFAFIPGKNEGTLAAASLAVSSAALLPFSNEKLFLFFLKVGSVLFGSGYVLLAFLRADLVDNWHWLTEAQLLDAVAVGQFTPGPVFTTATFIGYVLSGPAGAVLATLGIFFPAFFFVAISAPFIPRLRASRLASSVLDAVNVASLAVMTVTAFFLAKSSVIDVTTALLACFSAILLVRFKVNSAWLVLAGAIIGFGMTNYL